ncbi:Cupin domain-containing protein [Brevibacterium sp. Mu109]|nr:Cupin domain-containing protein [Brevibacterium sp. Mu109]
MDRLAGGLKRERERQGLSLSETAKRAGIGKSTLSQLESGAGNPSVETLWAIATALGVQISRLLETDRPPLSVIRRGEAMPLPSTDADYSAALLSACPPHARRDVFLVQLEPGSARVAQPHPVGTIEHLVVSAGSLRLTIDGESIDLDPGDYARHAGDSVHAYEALTPDTMAVCIVEAS